MSDADSTWSQSSSSADGGHELVDSASKSSRDSSRPAPDDGLLFVVDDLLFWPSLKSDARDGLRGEERCVRDDEVTYGEFGCSRSDLEDSGPALVFARGREATEGSGGLGRFSDDIVLIDMLVDELGIGGTGGGERGSCWCLVEWLFFSDRSMSRRARMPRRPLLRRGPPAVS